MENQWPSRWYLFLFTSVDLCWAAWTMTGIRVGRTLMTTLTSTTTMTIMTVEDGKIPSHMLRPHVSL
jgi:hypothetical protein